MASALEFVPKGTAGDKSSPAVPVTLTGINWNTMENVVVFQAIVNEDVDGAPTAYGPLGILPKPLDKLQNATNDENAVFNADGKNTWLWTSVVNRLAGDTHGGVQLETDLRMKDKKGRFPVIRQAGIGRGYYISTTAVGTGIGNSWDSSAYFDGTVVPYSALTPALADIGVGYGDYGLAIRPETGQSMPFSFLDWGNHRKVGEISGKLFDYFFPHNDQEGKPISFLVFPGSGPKPSGDVEKYKAEIKRRLTKLSAAPNADELTLLLALDASLARLNLMRSSGNASAGAGSRYQGLARVLQEYGYRPSRSGPGQVPEPDPVPGDYPMGSGRNRMG